jgi:hypothetical protein
VDCRIEVDDDDGDATPEAVDFVPEYASALRAAAASLSVLSTCMMELVAAVLLMRRLVVIESDEMAMV